MKSKLQNIKITAIKHTQWLQNRKIIVTWELRNTEAALIREDIINKNHENDVNHKMLLHEKITTNISRYPI